MNIRFKVTIMLLLIIVAISCQKNRGKQENRDIGDISSNDTIREKDQLTDENEVQSLCFMRITPTDTINTNNGKIVFIDTFLIKMNIFESVVKGEYNWLPYEQDHIRGEFNGVIENDEFIVKMLYQTEGMKITESMIFKVNDEGIWEKRGNKIERNGVFYYEDASQAEYHFLAPGVNCE